MLGLFFLYSWKCGDELEVHVGSAREWGYADVNLGHLECEVPGGDSDVDICWGVAFTSLVLVKLSLGLS